MPLVFSVVVKIVPRVLPVIEAVMALAILDEIL